MHFSLSLSFSLCSVEKGGKKVSCKRGAAGARRGKENHSSSVLFWREADEQRRGSFFVKKKKPDFGVTFSESFFRNKRLCDVHRIGDKGRNEVWCQRKPFEKSWWKLSEISSIGADSVATTTKIPNKVRPNYSSFFFPVLLSATFLHSFVSLYPKKRMGEAMQAANKDALGKRLFFFFSFPQCFLSIARVGAKSEIDKVF